MKVSKTSEQEVSDMLSTGLTDVLRHIIGAAISVVFGSMLAALAVIPVAILAVSLCALPKTALLTLILSGVALVLFGTYATSASDTPL